MYIVWGLQTSRAVGGLIVQTLPQLLTLQPTRNIMLVVSTSLLISCMNDCLIRCYTFNAASSAAGGFFPLMAAVAAAQMR